MTKIKLLDDNSELVNYNFSHFNIKSKKALLSNYPNMSAINHWHDDFEFTIILNGKMTYFINGTNYEINQGQAIFVNSKQMHYGYSSDGTDCEFICILIPPIIFSSIYKIKDSYIDSLSNNNSQPFFIFDSSIPWQKNTIEMLINIYELCNYNANGFELAVMGNFYLIFYNLYENFKNNQNSKTNYYNKDLEALHNMIGYIQKNYHSKISLKEIAASGNVCRSNCCAIFQSILSKSPITYLTDYRLEKALKLLDNNSASITSIALQCGFNSSSYFTETFHKKLGCTPSQYKKKYKNGS